MKQKIYYIKDIKIDGLTAAEAIKVLEELNPEQVLGVGEYSVYSEFEREETDEEEQFRESVDEKLKKIRTESMLRYAKELGYTVTKNED